MRKRLVALVCAVQRFFLCSCVQETATVTPRKSKLAPPFAPLTEIRAGRKNIYIVVKDLESGYWKVVLDGAKDAGENH